MFRRIVVPRSIALSCFVRSTARFYTPPEDLKKLYESSFDDGQFPLNVAPSDSCLFAKFLYKASEPKNALDTPLKDFASIRAISSKLPVFWERTHQIDQIPEFQSLSPLMLFTLHWMHANNMLENINDVAAIYETYANAKQKKCLAKIYVRDANSPSFADGKKLAEEMQKMDTSLNGYTLDCKTVVDTTILEGFAVELNGVYANRAKGIQKAGVADDEVDFTNIPAVKVAKTVFEDTVETEVLRKYVDQLELYDLEEAKNGV